MKLSIITINLNNAEGLAKTIESVLNQTFTDYEYLIIDGGSNDGSVDLIKRYSGKIAYWVSEPDTGVYNAMNKGLKMVSGEIITFINSGDIYCNPESLENANRFIKGMISYADLFFFDYLFHTRDQNQLISSADVTNKYVIYKKGFGHPSTFYKKYLFDLLGFFDEGFKIAGDRAFYMKAIVMKGLPFAYFSFPVSVFNDGGLSMNHHHEEILQLENKTIIDSYYSGFEKLIIKTRGFNRIFSVKFFRLLIISIFGWKLNCVRS